jgi:hypothetical protein
MSPIDLNAWTSTYCSVMNAARYGGMDGGHDTEKIYNTRGDRIQCFRSRVNNLIFPETRDDYLPTRMMM